jgi:hypothetical protein
MMMMDGGYRRSAGGDNIDESTCSMALTEIK